MTKEVIAPDEAHFPTKKYWYFSYFCTKMYVVGTQGGTFNEYPQHTFSRSNKKQVGHDGPVTLTWVS